MSGSIYSFTDEDGDVLAVTDVTDVGYSLVCTTRGSGSVALDREQVVELWNALGSWLRDNPTAEQQALTPEQRDGLDELAQQLHGDGSEPIPSVALDAHEAVYGDRQGDYGHPRENMTRAAIMWTALLQRKLADGEHVEPEDIGRCMVAMKLSRDVNAPKRDNRVDIAGYAVALDRLETGQ